MLRLQWQRKVQLEEGDRKSIWAERKVVGVSSGHMTAKGQRSEGAKGHAGMEGENSGVV